MITAVVGIFFCQAEDGIRVTSVTGVQTCALPIWIMLDAYSRVSMALQESAATVPGTRQGGSPAGRGLPFTSGLRIEGVTAGHRVAARRDGAMRSEERRVGKGVRSRGPRHGWK